VRADFLKKYSYFPAVTKPVIAGINGPVVGLGLVDRFVLRFAFGIGWGSIRHSVCPTGTDCRVRYGMDATAPRGHANTLDLLFTARMIDAAKH